MSFLLVWSPSDSGMRPTLPPAGYDHPTLCTPAFKHGGSQLLSARPLQICPGCPSKREVQMGTVRPRPQGCTATFCLLPGPAGAVAISPSCTGQEAGSSAVSGVGTLSWLTPCGFWCRSFPWPDCPPAEKHHKGYAEMCVLGAVLSALLNETPWNMPGSPWGC